MSTQNFKFDNFNENNTNRFSVVVCKQIFQLPNDLKTVWLYGPIGSGKTHLLCATKNHFNQKYSVVFLTAKELTNKLLDYNHQSQLKKIDEADLLIIDDADYLVSKTTAQEEIAKLIFKKESKGQRSLFASNCEPKKLSILFKHFFNDALFADVGFTLCGGEYSLISIEGFTKTMPVWLHFALAAVKNVALYVLIVLVLGLISAILLQKLHNLILGKYKKPKATSEIEQKN